MKKRMKKNLFNSFYITAGLGVLSFMIYQLINCPIGTRVITIEGQLYTQTCQINWLGAAILLFILTLVTYGLITNNKKEAK